MPLVNFNELRCDVIRVVFLAMVTAAMLLPSDGLALTGSLRARMGKMSGQVVFEGRPLGDAFLAFFDVKKGLPPIGGQAGRIPDLRSYSDPEGRFTVQLLDGTYYLGVLLRGPSEKLGPPRKGEFYYFADGGEGKLRKLTIEDFKEVSYGVVECALPGKFQETEDQFVVTGTVLEGAGNQAPYPGAIIMAKTVASAMKPEYVSAETGADGKFSLSLPPGKTYYLMARTEITGNKPAPGEDIGKYGANTFETNSKNGHAPGPPPGTSGEKPVRIISDEALPVSGENGQVVSGLTIYMYKMPDQQSVQESIRGAVDAPNYELGASINNILFENNKYRLKESSFAELDQWVRFLLGRPDIMIELGGHSDATGDEQYNLWLSERRAQEVATYLSANGVDPHRITVIGYGESKPLESNQNKSGRMKNRRVEIRFVQ